MQKEAADKDGHPGMPQSETSILNLWFNLKGLFICRQQMSAELKGVEKSVIKSSFSWLIHWMELSSDRNMLSTSKWICSPQILPQLSVGVNLPGCIATNSTLNYWIKTEMRKSWSTDWTLNSEHRPTMSPADSTFWGSSCLTHLTGWRRYRRRRPGWFAAAGCVRCYWWRRQWRRRAMRPLGRAWRSGPSLQEGQRDSGEILDD